MHRLVSTTIAAVSLLLIAQPVAAQDEDRWYLSAAGTISSLNSAQGTIANAPAAGLNVITQNPYETGYGLQIAFGREIGDFRLEAELGYNRDTQDEYTAVVPPTGRIPADATFKKKRAMVNGYWDITSGRVVPYVGAGVGVAEVDLLFIAARAPFPTEAPRTLIDGSDTRFVYQLMAGLGWKISDKVTLTGQYRWLDAGKVVIDDTRNEPTSRKHRGHNFDIGLRFEF